MRIRNSPWTMVVKLLLLKQQKLWTRKSAVIALVSLFIFNHCEISFWIKLIYLNVFRWSLLNQFASPMDEMPSRELLSNELNNFATSFINLSLIFLFHWVIIVFYSTNLSLSLIYLPVFWSICSDVLLCKAGSMTIKKISDSTIKWSCLFIIPITFFLCIKMHGEYAKNNIKKTLTYYIHITYDINDKTYVFRMINEHINDIQKRTRIVYYWMNIEWAVIGNQNWTL